MPESDRELARAGGLDSDDDLTAVRDSNRLVLGDLLNHVLDRGVVLTGEVTISVANIDLVRVGLSVVIAAVETLQRRQEGAASHAVHEEVGADIPVLPADGAR